MPGIVISPRAAADIDDIWEYTDGRWGERQAEIYLRLIQAAIGAVAANPKAGRTCDDVRPGYRKYPVGSHMLFYRVTKAAIWSYVSCISEWMQSVISESRRRS